MDELYRRIGGRIRDRRRSLKILQEDLAQRTGLSRGSISNIEAGRQQLYIHHLVAIATALRQDAGKLLAELDEVDEAAPRRLMEAVRHGTAERVSGASARRRQK